MEHHACSLGVFPLQYSALFALRKSGVDLIMFQTIDGRCWIYWKRKIPLKFPKGSIGSNRNEYIQMEKYFSIRERQENKV